MAGPAMPQSRDRPLGRTLTGPQLDRSKTQISRLFQDDGNGPAPSALTIAARKVGRMPASGGRSDGSRPLRSANFRDGMPTKTGRQKGWSPAASKRLNARRPRLCQNQEIHSRSARLLPTCRQRRHERLDEHRRYDVPTHQL
jgi:hypothetical protein